MMQPKIRNNQVRGRFNELKEKGLHVKKAQDILRAYNHPFRQAILATIANKIELNVTELYRNFDVAQPVASQHLAILREAGLVNYRREGRGKLYSINQIAIDDLVEQCKSLVTHIAH
jgi:DNA-binding transcriptional ArsR family regulator